MAAGNQVTLTFAGDSAKLESAFDKVGAGAKAMTTDVGHASKAMDEHGNALGRLGEKADGSERNLIGIHDVVDGTAAIMQGPGKAGITAYIQGWADLAGGIAPLLVSLAEAKLSVIGNTVATVAHTVAMVAVRAATVVWTGVQWLLNAALNANPIGLVVIGIIALIAIIEVVVHNTAFFRAVWEDTWSFMKGVAAWFSGPFVHGLGDAWHAIVGFGESALDWFKGLPAALGKALAGVASFLLSPFRGAFNSIADAWNHTIGSLSWTVPSWVPGIGGDGISAPKLPHFHGGTVSVPGAPGSEMLAVLQAGETVASRGSADGRGTTYLRPGNEIGRMLIQILRDAIAAEGGDPVVVLGS